VVGESNVRAPRLPRRELRTLHVLPASLTRSGSSGTGLLDRGLNPRTGPVQLRIDSVTVKNWEEARTEIEVRLYPRIQV
jgi:hypothetical protein